MGSNGDLRGVNRRPSASATNILQSVSVTTTTTRVHRSNDSHHGFVGIHPTNAGPAGFSPAAAAGSPQSKAVLALIKRLTGKVNTGVSILQSAKLQRFIL